ncbi:MAG: hypothetical protein ACYS8W_06625 [Planctomycetota bacterium]|jgi:hypothetical protein
MRMAGNSILIAAVIAFVLGMVICTLLPERAAAEDPFGAGGELCLMNGQDENGGKNYILVLDRKEMRLCVYGIRSAQLHLLWVRNLTYDMQVPYDFDAKGKYVGSKEIEKALKKPSNTK